VDYGKDCHVSDTMATNFTQQVLPPRSLAAAAVASAAAAAAQPPPSSPLQGAAADGGTGGAATPAVTSGSVTLVSSGARADDAGSGDGIARGTVVVRAGALAQRMQDAWHQQSQRLGLTSLVLILGLGFCTGVMTCLVMRNSRQRGWTVDLL
jgi:hypothetical protein